MTLAQPLPTKANEAWRYADLKSVESIWQAVDTTEPIVVAAGEQASQTIILDAGEAGIADSDFQASNFGPLRRRVQA